MIKVERLTEYSAKDAREIGALMPDLDPSFSSDPINQKLLSDIISSPYHEQLVVRDETGRIFGTATLSITIGVGAGRKAYLEDFVTDQKNHIPGGGQALWDEMGRWCTERSLLLQFTSNPKRIAAHKFYARNGAAQYMTDVFHKQF